MSETYKSEQAAWMMFEALDPLTQKVIATLLDAEKARTEERIIKLLEDNYWHYLIADAIALIKGEQE